MVKWTNYLNPSNIKGLSALTMLLAMLGNGLMLPRALFIRDLMWYLNSLLTSLFNLSTALFLSLWLSPSLPPSLRVMNLSIAISGLLVQLGRQFYRVGVIWPACTGKY